MGLSAPAPSTKKGGWFKGIKADATFGVSLIVPWRLLQLHPLCIQGRRKGKWESPRWLSVTLCILVAEKKNVLQMTFPKWLLLSPHRHGLPQLHGKLGWQASILRTICKEVEREKGAGNGNSAANQPQVSYTGGERGSCGGKHAAGVSHSHEFYERFAGKLHLRKYIWWLRFPRQHDWVICNVLAFHGPGSKYRHPLSSQTLELFQNHQAGLVLNCTCGRAHADLSGAPSVWWWACLLFWWPWHQHRRFVWADMLLSKTGTPGRLKLPSAPGLLP